MTTYRFYADRRLACGGTMRTVGTVDAPSMDLAHRALKIEYPGCSISTFSSQDD